MPLLSSHKITHNHNNNKTIRAPFLTLLIILISSFYSLLWKIKDCFYLIPYLVPGKYSNLSLPSLSILMIYGCTSTIQESTTELSTVSLHSHKLYKPKNGVSSPLALYGPNLVSTLKQFTTSSTTESITHQPSSMKFKPTPTGFLLTLLISFSPIYFSLLEFI